MGDYAYFHFQTQLYSFDFLTLPQILDSQTAFDLNSMNSLSSSDSESASSQGLFFVKLENNDSFNSQRTMTKKSLDLPTSHSMHTFSLPHHGKQKVKSSGSFRHPVEYSGKIYVLTCVTVE